MSQMDIKKNYRLLSVKDTKIMVDEIHKGMPDMSKREIRRFMYSDAVKVARIKGDDIIGDWEVLLPVDHPDLKEEVK